MGREHEPRRVRFGVFDLDVVTGELSKSGVRIKLQDQPCQILRALVLEPGELVTRERLQEKLWHEETYVDFDHSLNAAVKKLRDILSDDARSPRFIETLPKKGYRFIAPVEAIDDPAEPTNAATVQRPRKLLLALASVGIAVSVLAGYIAWPKGEPLPHRFIERPLTSDTGSESLPSFSPDGTRVAYSWSNRADGTTDSDIYIRLVDEPSGIAQPLTQGPESDWWPTWSPEGTKIAFVREDNPTARFAAIGGPFTLMVVPASGGPARTLLRFASRGNFYAKPAWSQSGKHIVLAGQLDPEKPTRTNRLLLYSMETGEATALSEEIGGTGYHHPVFSPDGDKLVFRRGFAPRGLCVLDLDRELRPRGDPKTIVPGVWWSPAWSAGGERLFFLSIDDEAGLWSAAASGGEPAKFVWSTRSDHLTTFDCTFRPDACGRDRRVG
jgi:DNA-binding winged helix-turn-helix (wHTH) protein